MMEHILSSSEEIQVLKIRLLNEVKSVYRTLNHGHSSIYQRLLETRSHVIGDTLEMIAKKHNIKLHELASLVNDKIETAEREVDVAVTFLERENLYHRISAYEYIFEVVKKVSSKYRL
jgi:hypothetical protein